MPKWYDSKVIRIEQASPNTKRFWVEIPELEQFSFKAGQFVTMDLPLGEKRLQRWRSYSIANAPNGGNVLEFCIVNLEGGIASNYLFNEVTEGSILRFKGPDGTFTLPETIEKDLVLLCTGTGVAPFRSMLLDVLNKGQAHRDIHLIFGTRYANGILYKDEFEKMVTELPGFRYSVALSREMEFPKWNTAEIRSGYIHQIYIERYSKVRPDVVFYICGWSKMIDEAVANLVLKLRYDRTQVRYELYG